MIRTSIGSFEADKVAVPFDEGRIRPIEVTALTLFTVWLIALQYIQWPVLLHSTFPKFNDSVVTDPATFAVAGQLINKGASPYIDYWDERPPLVPLINAASLALSNGNLWGIWLISFLAVFSAIMLGYYALRQTFGMPATMVGMALFSFSLAGILTPNLAQDYALPAQWVAVLLLVRWTSFDRRVFAFGLLLGVIFGLTFLLSATLIAAPLSVALSLSSLLLFQTRIAAFARFVAGTVAGFALPAASVTAYLLWHGSLPAFWYQVIQDHDLPLAHWKMLFRAIYNALALLSFHGPAVLPFAALFIAIARLWSLPISHPLYPVFLFGVIWLPLELIFAVDPSGLQGSYTLIPLLSPLAFLATQCVADITSSKATRDRPVAVRRICVAMAFGLLFLPAGETYVRLGEHGLLPQRMAQVDPVVRYIRQHTDDHDSLFVWGQAPDLYFLADRRPASRFINPSPLLLLRHADITFAQAFLLELEASAPPIVVEAPDAGIDEPYWDFAFVPSLSDRDPEWRFPDPRTPRFSWWRLPSRWTTTPAVQAFYEYLDRHYTVTAQVGPRGWVIYRRIVAPSQS